MIEKSDFRIKMSEATGIMFSSTTSERGGIGKKIQENQNE